METRLIETTIHGRYLLERRGGERLLIGFHGYGENAERHLAELRRIPGIERWSVASVQALHRFYNSKTQEVIASWMTREDREEAIEDNLGYVERILGDTAAPLHLVFAGFSQGAAMAYRAASRFGAAGLIVLGGDLPPDVTGNLPPMLLGRGTRDDWYSDEKLRKDVRFLEGITTVTTCVFEGGHEWTDEFRAAAGDFLSRLA